MARPGEMIRHSFTGERITVLQTADQTGGGYIRLELAVAPGAKPRGAHRHPARETRYLIVSGVLDFVVDGRRFRVGPGGRVMVPAGTVHSWKNGGGAEAVAVVDLVPAPGAEWWLASASDVAPDGSIDSETGALGHIHSLAGRLGTSEPQAA